jgi:hypothetical protein
MDRWMEWVVAILIVAGIIAMVSLARGEPGRNDLPPAATITSNVAAR